MNFKLFKITSGMVGGEAFGGRGRGERRKCGRERFDNIKMRNKEEDDGEGRRRKREGGSEGLI